MNSHDSKCKKAKNQILVFYMSQFMLQDIFDSLIV